MSYGSNSTLTELQMVIHYSSFYARIASWHASYAGSAPGLPKVARSEDVVSPQQLAVKPNTFHNLRTLFANPL